MTQHPVPQVTVYTRTRCHLCDEAKDQLRELQKQVPFAIEEIDIDSDSELQARYNEEVPVIFIEGRKAFKYRVDGEEFLKKLRQLSPRRS